MISPLWSQTGLYRALSHWAYKYGEVTVSEIRSWVMPFSQMRLEDSSSEHHWTFSASKDRMKVKVSPSTGLLNRVLLRLFDKTFDIWATNITPSRQKLCAWQLIYIYCEACAERASLNLFWTFVSVFFCCTDASQNLIDLLLFRINAESDSVKKTQKYYTKK